MVLLYYNYLFNKPSALSYKLLLPVFHGNSVDSITAHPWEMRMVHYF